MTNIYIKFFTKPEYWLGDKFDNKQVQNYCCCGNTVKLLQIMPERKVWSPQEDRVLKLLVEQRGLTKWSQISRTMQEQFQLFGRNGKQCRQRYHNHLDCSINNADWSPEEERLLFEMQEQVGNKWALISSRLHGRTDNCVKNHFYSKLRKGLRTLNKKIHKNLKKEFREVKTTTLYRLIEAADNKQAHTETSQLCKNIKNQLRHYDGHIFETQEEQLQFARGLIELIATFDKDIRKNARNPKGSKKSLKGSIKLEQGDNGNAGLVSSTKSIYDDSSESFSNSDLFSSSSFDHRSLKSSQQLLKPTRIFRSQNIKSQSQDDSGEEMEGKVLYNSANSLTKSAGSRMPAIKQESIKLQNSAPSSQSENSQDSGSNRMYMFGQESLEMRVHSPKQLTIEEKMQIHEDDLLFYGNMEIEQDDLVKDFSQMKLAPIPKLGKDSF